MSYRILPKNCKIAYIYVQFLKKSTPMEGHWKFFGVGGLGCPNFRSLIWNFLGGRGVQNRKPSVGGVWIFSATAQCYIFQINSENVNIAKRVFLFNIFLTEKALVNGEQS